MIQNANCTCFIFNEVVSGGLKECRKFFLRRRFFSKECQQRVINTHAISVSTKKKKTLK